MFFIVVRADSENLNEMKLILSVFLCLNLMAEVFGNSDLAEIGLGEN